MCCYAEMKTVKYTTTKKSKNKQGPLPAEVAVIADLASTYIASWTKKELQRLQHDIKPICVPIKGGYIVGKYTIKKLDTEQWRVFDQDHAKIQDFYYKQGAILFAIYSSKNHLITAKELLSLDAEFTKHDNDIRMYKYSIDRAIANKNYFLYDKLISRLDVSKKKKELANEGLQRLFNKAKYYKIWE
jgi:hypothetical protein